MTDFKKIAKTALIIPAVWLGLNAYRGGKALVGTCYSAGISLGLNAYGALGQIGAMENGKMAVLRAKTDARIQAEQFREALIDYSTSRGMFGNNIAPAKTLAGLAAELGILTPESIQKYESSMTERSIRQEEADRKMQGYKTLSNAIISQVE